MSATHTAVAITAKGVISTIQVPTTLPGPEEVLIKASYGSLIAFDTYMTDSAFFVNEYPTLLSFNVSGTIQAVGDRVPGLRVGDRVTAAAFGANAGKASQEYCLLHYHRCAKIPSSLPLDAAATIPDNFITAFHSIVNGLGLPVSKTLPATESPKEDETPILVYGAGATSGQYAIQILRSAGYKNIIATASERHHSYLKSLGATHIFSYTSPTLASEISQVVATSANPEGKIRFVLDCITTFSTITAISEIIDPNAGVLALLLPIKEGDKVTGPAGSTMHMQIPEHYEALPSGVKVVGVETFKYAQDEYLKSNLMPTILPSLLEAGTIQPNRVRLLDESTHETLQGRIEVGLDLLRNNKISGEKVVVKVAS